MKSRNFNWNFLQKAAHIWFKPFFLSKVMCEKCKKSGSECRMDLKLSRGRISQLRSQLLDELGGCVGWFVRPIQLQERATCWNCAKRSCNKEKMHPTLDNPILGPKRGVKKTDKNSKQLIIEEPNILFLLRLKV